jgi:hypothetical protein
MTNMLEEVAPEEPLGVTLRKHSVEMRKYQVVKSVKDLEDFAAMEVVVSDGSTLVLAALVR